MDSWLADELRDDVMQVPGIGPAAAKLLATPVKYTDGRLGEPGDLLAKASTRRATADPRSGRSAPGLSLA